MLTHRHATILGDIPGDWGTVVLRECLDLPNSFSGDWGSDQGEVSLRVLRSTNFTNDGQLILDEVAERFFTARAAADLSLAADDLLVERSGGGPDQPVGRVVLVREAMPGYGFGNFVHRLRLKAGAVNSRYLYYCLVELHRSGTIERVQVQTTQMRNLEFRDYLRLRLPLPPPAEQVLIASVIDSADGVIQATKRLLGVSASLHRDQMQGPAYAFKVSLLQNLLTGTVRLADGAPGPTGCPV
jgi:type I restriction enzyme S subunit